MAGKIFVNYRREDSAANALAIASYLERAFGGSRVFIDVDRLRPGQDFPKELEKRLSACKVMLCLIGPGWLNARNEEGARRLDEPLDWVRLEIERAFARNLTVIPVLTGGASLPKAADLPESLKPLVERHAVSITTNGFRSNIAGLTRDIRAIIGGGTPWAWIGAGAGALALAGVAVISLPQQGSTPNPLLPPSLGPGANAPSPADALKAAQAAEVARIIATGEDSFKDHDYDRAITAYTQAIGLDPQNARVYALRSWAYSRKRDQAHELEDAEKAVALDPKLALGHSMLSGAYRNKGDLDHAMAEANKAIELDPKFARGYYNRGALYYDKKDYDRALADYNKAIDLDPKDAPAYNNRGRVYSARKDYDRALADYNKAIDLDPKYALAYNNRGDAYKAKGNATLAAADYARGKELGYKP
jgi:Flp pilus assembly protein TadD